MLQSRGPVRFGLGSMVLGFTTTHSEVDLERLLRAIRMRLEDGDPCNTLCDDYKLVYDINKSIERDIACRHTRDEYRDWVRAAGFEILRDVPDT